MYNEAVDERERKLADRKTVVIHVVPLSEINRLGDDASACDATVRKMWNALYATELAKPLPF
jgi:hypothetical protein